MKSSPSLRLFRCLDPQQPAAGTSPPFASSSCPLPVDEPLLVRRRTLLCASLLGLVPASIPAAAPSPADRDAPALRALNVSKGDYYNSVFPFSNLIRQSGWVWTPATWADNETGWLRGLPPGKEAHAWVVLHLDPVHGTFMPGDYVATSASRATLSLVTLSQDLVADAKGGVGRLSFSVPRRPDGNYTRLSIAIRCRNDTDGPLDVTDLAVHRVSADGPAVPPASEFHPAWIASNRGASLIRTMDWGAINHSPVTTPRELPRLTDRTWVRGVPYAVQARAAAALGADLWVCVPHGGQNYQYVCSAATRTFTTVSTGKPLPHGFAERSPIVFVDYSQGRASLPEPLEFGRTYYAVGCRDAEFQVADAPDGRALELAADVGPSNYSRVSSAIGIDGLSRLYEEIARQVASGLPRRTTVYVEYSNEVWNFAFVQGHFARQVLGRLAAEPGVSAAGYGVGSLLAWRAFERVLGRDRVRRVFCGQSAWFEALAPGLDYVDRGLLARDQSVGRLADVYAVAPYVFPHDERGKPMQMKELLDADAVHWSDARWDSAFDAHLALLAPQIAAHVGKVRSRNPGLVCTTYECGQHVAGSAPAGTDPQRLRDLQQRYLQYLNGRAGAAMYQRYHDAVFQRNGLRHFNHFTDAGGYFSTGQVFQWGLKPSHLSEDNARVAFFRSLPSTAHA